MLTRGSIGPRLRISPKLSTTSYASCEEHLKSSPCGEIANRMITRDPDVTRLLDRMEKRGLISRARESRDRRMAVTSVFYKINQ